MTNPSEREREADILDTNRWTDIDYFYFLLDVARNLAVTLRGGRT